MIVVEIITHPDAGALHCPIIRCDACGGRIRQHGNAYWLSLPTGELHPRVWHTHKHPCSSFDRVLQARYGGLVLSAELDRWLGQLGHNFTDRERNTR